MRCPVCKSEDECKPKGFEIGLTRYRNWLTARDWQDLYNLMRLVYLPAVHRILARAEKRHKKKIKGGPTVIKKFPMKDAFPNEKRDSLQDGD